MAANEIYTLLDAATEVSQAYGDTSDISIAKAKKWCNRALVRMAEIHDWSWLKVFDASIATVSGTESYSLASGVKKIYAIWLQDSARRKLRLIDDRRFREIYTQATTPQGNPLYYRNYGRDSSGNRKIALYPVPNAVLTLKYDYVKEITLLVNNTDDVREVTGMPAHMVDAWIELATAIGYREQDDSDYQSAMAEAVERVIRLAAEDGAEIDDEIRAAAFGDSGNDWLDPVLPPRFGM
jgi:hypothetical protein